MRPSAVPTRTAQPRVRPADRAVGAYALGVAAALFVVLAHDRPFVGHSAVKPLPIAQAIDRMERDYR
jgi:hypothetical protein